MADDCSAGFAIMPIIMVVVFISILSRALRAASRTGGYSGYGGARYRTYGSGFYALQYLAQQGSSRPYQSGGYSGYNPPYTPPSSYRAQPYAPSYSQPAYAQPGYGQPGYAGPESYPQSRSYPGSQPPSPTSYPGQYGPGFQSAPAPAYSTGRPAGIAQSAPAPEAPKVSCSYCSSLNPGTERNCLLCGAPIK